MASTDKMEINDIVDLISDEQRKQLADDMHKMHEYIIKWVKPYLGKRRTYSRAILKVYAVDGVEGNYVEKIEMAKSLLSNMRIRIRLGHDPINSPDIYVDAYYSSIEALESDLQCIEESIYTEPTEVELPPEEETEIIDNGEEL